MVVVLSSRTGPYDEVDDVTSFKRATYLKLIVVVLRSTTLALHIASHNVRAERFRQQVLLFKQQCHHILVTQHVCVAFISLQANSTCRHRVAAFAETVDSPRGKALYVGICASRFGP